MKIYVEYDAAALVALGLAADLACDAVIMRHGDPGEMLASTSRANPLADGWVADVTAPGDVILGWSGTLASDLFESHPATWLRPGRDALERFCAELAPQLQAHEKTLCFHPHSRHVLSDPASCLAFAREQTGPFTYALAPAEMLEPVMLVDIDDHLTRMFEALGPTCAMVVLHDVAAEDDRCAARPLGEGRLPADHVRALLSANVSPETAVVLTGERLERQLEWLAG